MGDDDKVGDDEEDVVVVAATTTTTSDVCDDGRMVAKGSVHISLVSSSSSRLASFRLNCVAVSEPDAKRPGSPWLRPVGRDSATYGSFHSLSLALGLGGVGGQWTARSKDTGSNPAEAGHCVTTVG